MAYSDSMSVALHFTTGDFLKPPFRIATEISMFIFYGKISSQ